MHIAILACLSIAMENINPSWFKKHIKLWHGTLVLFAIAAIAGAAVFFFVYSERYDISGGLMTSSADDGHKEELENIKKAIKDKGAKWEAEDNPIFRLSNAEKKKLLGALVEEAPQAAAEFQATATITPASLDWRNEYGNFVTPVRNQGGCASCWAFAATAQLESYTLIKNNQPNTNFDTAEQILVSCSNFGSCGGGSPYYAGMYIRDMGLPLESCFPYTATDSSCSNACANWQESTYKVGSVLGVPNTLDGIKQALNTYGPLQTTMNVFSDFFSYRSGVYSHVSGTFQGGHAVLIVGYDDLGQYFIAKNSWGTGWGESGFFRIAYSELSSGSYFGSWSVAYSQAVPNVSSITVTTPNGGESFDAGGLSRKITWDYTGDTNAIAKIELLKNGVISNIITSSIALSNKTYNYWSIPQNQTPGSDYKIRITSTGNGVNDTSNSNFTITAPVPASISLISPNGGENWSSRSNQTVHWNFAGNPGISLKIDLLKSGVFYQTITTGINTSNGSYNWKIPSSQLNANDYQIKITSNSNSLYIDTSDNYFSISKISSGKGPVKK